MSSNFSSTSAASNTAQETVNGYQIPKWAGKPPSGLHLDVMKDGKMIQKLMIDEKKYYFFGRNKDVCDFVTDHASCSRVHAVLIWHKHLNRSFLVDLGSAHGTFIGTIRLEHHKPQQVFVDTEIKFGASTRTYIVRERPQINKHFPSMLISHTNNNTLSTGEGDLNPENNNENDDLNNSSLSMLPETEAELDNLTEFNTAHNKRIAQLVDITTNTNMPSNQMMVKRKKKTVTFCDEEEIINPEDVDPSIGRFRNMIQTSIVIPNRKKRPVMLSNQMQYAGQFQPNADIILKRARVEQSTTTKFTVTSKHSSLHHHQNEEETETLYDEEYEDSSSTGQLYISNMGINLAPDVNETYASTTAIHHTSNKTTEADLFRQQHLELINQQYKQHYQYYDRYDNESAADDNNEDDESNAHKKKYAKEAWPGRKPSNLSNTSETSHQTVLSKSPAQESIPKSKPLLKSPPRSPPPAPTSAKPNDSKRLII